MKNRMIYILKTVLFIFLFTIISCQSDDLPVLVPYSDDITFSDLHLAEEFTHEVADGGFTSGGIRFNSVKNSNGQLDAGFAYSNRSNRSFTWTGTETALDSNRYSVYTIRPNRTETYAVVKVRDDDAFFTLDKPSVIEHILVANTTYAYLALSYGDVFGTAETPAINPNIPSRPAGIWYTYVPGGVKKMEKADKDYYRIVAKGYNNNQLTGTLKFDLACKGSNEDNPDWDYIVDNWYKFSLASLGVVDKVVFDVESSDRDSAGNIRTPQWFCLDGIRLQTN